MDNEIKKDIGEEILSKLKVLEIVIQSKLRALQNEKELSTSFISRI